MEDLFQDRQPLLPVKASGGAAHVGGILPPGEKGFQLSVGKGRQLQPLGEAGKEGAKLLLADPQLGKEAAGKLGLLPGGGLDKLGEKDGAGLPVGDALLLA